MTTAATILGRWRIIGMSTWDNASIDLVEPGFIIFAARAKGDDGLWVVTAALDCAFDRTRCDVSFDFTGSDEGDQVSGYGWAELSGPDKITGEIAFHNGDDTTFEARRW